MFCFLPSAKVHFRPFFKERGPRPRRTPGRHCRRGPAGPRPRPSRTAQDFLETGSGRRAGHPYHPSPLGCAKALRLPRRALQFAAAVKQFQRSFSVLQFVDLPPPGTWRCFSPSLASLPPPLSSLLPYSGFCEKHTHTHFCFRKALGLPECQCQPRGRGHRARPQQVGGWVESWR